MAERFPTTVLSQKLSEAIRGRRVKAAIFTTFTFDPGFFELHVLPTLFDYPFHQADKVKRLQLEDQLQRIDDVSVYYDTSALTQDSTPAQLDFRRIGVRLRTGVFHPKLVIVLVESAPDDETQEEKEQSLIVGALSANLTQEGWWENVETGHFEEIADKATSNEVHTYRGDVFELVKKIRKLGDDAEQPAINLIYEFLRYRTSKETRASSYSRATGQYYPRIFFGQSKFAEWLKELGLGKRGHWNLEVISPYFDADFGGALGMLVKIIDPAETRIYLPTEADGAALVRESMYQAVKENPYISWATLPKSLTQRSNAETERRVHAKVYRLWNYGTGQQVIISGSVNLTRPAHSRSNAGNLEAAFLVGVNKVEFPLRWWLKPMDWAPTEFPETSESVEDECQDVFLDVALRFDWSNRRAAYFLDSDSPDQFKVFENNGCPLFDIDFPESRTWVELPEGPSTQMAEMLQTTSFAIVKHAKGQWRVLIREEAMAYRPSVLSELTPEEILMYWSLLTDSQKAAFLEERMVANGKGDFEGLSVQSYRYQAANTLFDRFSGIYHAFERLVKHVLDCLENGRLKEAEVRLLGSKYDSLPELLRKTMEENDDPVIQYVVFLSAQQAVNRVVSGFPDFWDSHLEERRRLESLLEHRNALLSSIHIEDTDKENFFCWYEDMFLNMIPQTEETN